MSENETPLSKTPETSEAGEHNTGVDWDRPETWPAEIGGQSGPEPTRYGDWEKNGRCSDF